MSNTETDFDEEVSEKKPRKSRKRNVERRVFVYRMISGTPKEQGSFPEISIGTPFERRLPMFVKELFGEGDYRIETRKPNGHFERAFDISIAPETEKPENGRQIVLNIDDEDFDDEPENLAFDNQNGQMNSVEVENLLLKERLKRLEDDYLRQKTGTQSDSQTLIAALEESRREQRELMMLMLTQSQKPQQDATTQAMNILEKSLGIVTKAKAISEEIAPTEMESSNSFLGDAAKLVDSLGKNAGTFLPMFLGRSVSVPTTLPTTAPRTANKPETNNVGQQGELTNLLAKVKNKKETGNNE